MYLQGPKSWDFVLARARWDLGPCIQVLHWAWTFFNATRSTRKRQRRFAMTCWDEAGGQQVPSAVSRLEVGDHQAISTDLCSIKSQELLQETEPIRVRLMLNPSVPLLHPVLLHTNLGNFRTQGLLGVNSPNAEGLVSSKAG